MEKYNYTIIEDWWRHNGYWDRYSVAEIENKDGEDMGDYLDRTDKWWDSLTDEEKVDVYNEFFNYS